MPHILVVCTANICRSPLVEALLKRELAARNLPWSVSSAGTWAEFTRGAAHYSQVEAEKRGLDLTGHQARMITAEMLEEATLVLCMTRNHVEALRAEFPEMADRIYLLSELIGRRFDISDPYGGPASGYASMARDTEKIVQTGIDRLIAMVDA